MNTKTDTLYAIIAATMGWAAIHLAQKGVTISTDVQAAAIVAVYGATHRFLGWIHARVGK